MTRYVLQLFKLLALGSLFIGGLAHAELTANAAALKKDSRTYAYLFSTASHQAMFKIGAYWDKLLGIEQDCKSNYNVTPIRLRIHTPIDLPDNSTHPVAGVWQFTFKFERCGEAKTYNAVFVSNKGAIPTVKPYFPGESLANTQLINDALQSAYAAASMQFKNTQCKDMTIYDMAVAKPPHDVIANGKRTRGVWNETWSFLGCGEVVGVDMTFVPDSKGIRFDARPLKPSKNVQSLPNPDSATTF
jgi:hypothetical protein